MSDLLESLEELQAKRDIVKELMKSLHLQVVSLRSELKTALDKWEVLDKEYRFLDRKIADRTKVTILRSKFSPKPPQGMTAKMAQNLLDALKAQGVDTNEQIDELPVYECEENSVSEEDLDILEHLVYGEG